MAVVVLADSYERLAGLDDWFRRDVGQGGPTPIWRADPHGAPQPSGLVTGLASWAGPTPTVRGSDLKVRR